ncbi:hypothetical protein DYBT9275_03138 [Dyadobacter sp. CECT 9275]|uniref:DUF4374 domain-containing protein n=2 Tax=Dyadobacter helix TaxID=2822344 RepID=A0A916JDX6_9BACT|nr:hypothetical protein DYBT9275_03138 [Dyadobacter sp. CECT 9275]
MRASGNFLIYIVFALLTFNALLGCSDSPTNDKKRFSIYVMAKDASEYIISTNDLSQGEVDPVKTGAKVSPPQIWYDLIVKDGSYFRVNQKTNFFVRFNIRNNEFIPTDSVKLSQFSYIDTYSWLHPDSLLLISYNRKSEKVRYAKVNTRTLEASTGDLAIPLPVPPYNSMSVGFTDVWHQKLFAGYTYHSTRIPQGYTTSDTAYVAIMDYPSFKPIKTLKDTRSTYPGGTNTAQPNTFRDEKGDFYFLACPGVALGNHPGKPTALYRIKAGDEVLDSSYFFNISASPIQNHAYGLWYIGNGKAIIRSERKGLFKGMEDHYKVPHVAFHVLDLATKTVKKLDLPLDKGTSRRCVLVEKGLVYISINSDTQGNYIWMYNPKDHSLKKGLKLAGNLDYILRIERLYDY